MSEVVTIIGAGHGGTAAAADLSSRGFRVTLYNRSEPRLEPLRFQQGIRFKDPEDRGLVPVEAFTTDVRQALAASTRIVVMVPTSGIEFYAREMASHLTTAHEILVAPGHTGGALLFRRVVVDETGGFPCRLAEVHTLPYICRMTAPGEVTLWKRADRLLFAALPARDTDALAATFATLFPSITPVRSVLETSLSNLNAVMHPGAMVLDAGWIEHTGGDFRFYSEGTTPAVGRIVAATDDDRRKIGFALGLELDSFLELFHAEGYATDEALAHGSVYEAIKDSPPNTLIRAPESLEHRYIREDVGYGLVPMSALATAAAVEVRTIDALIDVAGVAIGADLRADGLGAAKLGIGEMNADALIRYAETG